MKLHHPLLRHTVSLFGACAIRMWRQTIDWKAFYFDPTADPVHPRLNGRNVYVCWHEYMLMPIALRGHRGMLALTSQHGDGEMAGRAMRHLGWEVTPGSTTRGGVSAVLRLLRDDQRHLIVVPDGPRGPRRQLSQGAIYLASKLGLPLVCTGYGYDRPWRLRSWDRFAIPRPFSRARAMIGPALRLPPRLDRESLEAYRRWFEQLLNWLTEEAEAWAESGRRKVGELPMLPWEAPPAMFRREPDAVSPLPRWLATSWAALGYRHSPANATAARLRRAA